MLFKYSLSYSHKPTWPSCLFIVKGLLLQNRYTDGHETLICSIKYSSKQKGNNQELNTINSYIPPSKPKGKKGHTQKRLTFTYPWDVNNNTETLEQKMTNS